MVNVISERSVTCRNSPVIIHEVLTFFNHLAYHWLKYQISGYSGPRHGRVSCRVDGSVAVYGPFHASLALGIYESEDPELDYCGKGLHLVGSESRHPDL